MQYYYVKSELDWLQQVVISLKFIQTSIHCLFFIFSTFLLDIYLPLAIIIKSIQLIDQMLSSSKPHEPQQALPPWQTELKDSLIAKCQAFINCHTRSPSLIKKPNIWEHFISTKRFKEHHNYALTDHGHSTYSEYISIRSNQCHANEFSQYFHFIKHLLERNSHQYEATLFQISKALTQCKDYKQWMKISKKYAIGLTIEEMFYYYHLLLVKGISTLSQAITAKRQICDKAVFLDKILEVKKITYDSARINSHIAVSIDKGDQITLENLSKTLKYLFCSICMVYDCQRHFLPASAYENNFQYIQQYDIRQRLQNRKNSAHKLFHKIVQIIKKQITINDESYDSACSERCYQLMDIKSFNNLRTQRIRKIFSPVFKSLVKMGIQLFHYNPCKISLLFAPEQISKNTKKACEHTTCQLIFYYLILDYNLPRKIQQKFYQNEQEMLTNEVKAPCQSTALPKKKMEKKSIKKNNNQDGYNSVCFHYFLGKEPNDVTCLSCDCRKRGHCLPSCGCSELCEIRRPGCRCKRQSNCWENKCPCFKANMVCIPQTCEHCVKQDQSSQCVNWCKNNQKSMHQNKMTRIGTSKIQNAGLGLFAAQPILNGEFVIRYVGEIIESNSLELIRENLVQNNLFYTFKLKQEQSVDSRIFGNKARFINHSKKMANLIPRTIKINEQHNIVFHALRDIQEGQQLFFNYNGEGELSEFKQKYPFIEA